MKAVGYKLVTCKGTYLQHDKPNKDSPDQVEGYSEKRHRGLGSFVKLISGRYNVHNIFSYHDEDVDEDGDPVFVHGPPPSA